MFNDPYFSFTPELQFGQKKKVIREQTDLTILPGKKSTHKKKKQGTIMNEDIYFDIIYIISALRFSKKKYNGKSSVCY